MVSIAEQKRNDNIAEYIIYLWQMQDLLRAANFDSEALKAFLSQSFEGDQLKTELTWLMELAKQMKSQKVEQKGVLHEVSDILTELSFLHQTLLGMTKDDQYSELHKNAKPNIGAYLEKAAGSPRNDVEACLMALYGLLTLRLKGSEISDATKEAMQTFIKLMAYLSKKYKEMKSGQMDFSLN